MNSSGEMRFTIEQMADSDAKAVLAIYAAGIATGAATFETITPAWEQWDAGHLPVCRLVAKANETVIGWAALSPVSKRAVYAGVAEVSVYIDPACWKMGIGRALLEALIEHSEREGIWTLQASIFPENKGSIRLHLSQGFRELGRRERIAKRDGVWRDTIFFERRSRIVGID